MRLLIDGYNLCHAWGLLLPRSSASSHAGPHELQKARMQLLGRLLALCDETTAVTVVFDAAGAPAGAAAEDRRGAVRIHYALHGSADDVIEDLIAHDSDPRRLTVVSDDRRLQQAARRRHCDAWDSTRLEGELERRDRHRKESARSGTDKPDSVSESERRRWLAVFGDGDTEEQPW
jgi:predicted RNA-binding protein with PIN domain